MSAAIFIAHDLLLSASTKLSNSNRRMTAKLMLKNNCLKIHTALFIHTALAKWNTYTFQVTIQDPVSQIQCSEWNNTTGTKRSDPKVCTSD